MHSDKRVSLIIPKSQFPFSRSFCYCQSSRCLSRFFPTRMTYCFVTTISINYCWNSPPAEPYAGGHRSCSGYMLFFTYSCLLCLLSNNFIANSLFSSLPLVTSLILKRRMFSWGGPACCLSSLWSLKVTSRWSQTLVYSRFLSKGKVKVGRSGGLLTSFVDVAIFENCSFGSLIRYIANVKALRRFSWDGPACCLSSFWSLNVTSKWNQIQGHSRFLSEGSLPCWRRL